MGTKKDIGSAIKERMVDYKSSPDPELWQNVKANLELKNRKRVIYKWLYFSGALVLIIGFSLILITTNTLKTTNSNQIALPQTEDVNLNNNNLIDKSNEVNATSITISEETNESFTTNKPESKNNDFDTNVQKNNAVNRQTKEKTSIVNSNKPSINKTEKESIAVKSSYITQSGKYDRGINKSPQSARSFDNKNSTNTAYIRENNQSDNSSKKVNNPSKNEYTELKNESNLVQNNENLTYNFAKNSADSLESKMADIKLKQTDSLKKIKEKEEQIANLILLRKKDSLKKAERFYSFTVFSGISTNGLFNSDSNIDPIFNDNNTEQVIKLNYGATVNFNTDTRFSIRTGVFYQQYQTTVNNVNPFTSLQFVNVVPSPEELNSFFNNGTNFKVEQEYSYIRIPLEIRYDLLKNSSLLGFIGSVNFSMLRNNSVSLTDGNNNSLEIGRSSLAENDLSLGAGLNYRPKLTERLFINLEGIFYYQPFHYNNLPVRADVEFQFRVGLEYKLKL